MCVFLCICAFWEIAFQHNSAKKGLKTFQFGYRYPHLKHVQSSFFCVVLTSCPETRNQKSHFRHFLWVKDKKWMAGIVLFSAPFGRIFHGFPRQRCYFIAQVQSKSAVGHILRCTISGAVLPHDLILFFRRTTIE